MTGNILPVTFAASASMALAIAAVLPPMRVVAVSPRPQVAGGRPQFDVVSVKKCDPNAPPPAGGRSTGAGQASPVHFQLNCRSVNILILDAYVTFADGRYSRPSERPIFDLFNVGPDWIRSEKFTIEATAAGATPTSIMQGPMLQAVLEDRFKLKVHRETRDMPVYDLVVGKGGSKLTPFKPGTCVPWDYSVFPPPPLEAGQRRCTAGQQSNGDGKYVQNVEALTLDDWISSVGIPTGRRFDRQIVNKTGITGLQTFRFVTSGNPDDYAAELKNQLGLELRPGRAPREFLILDHVERPVPDEPLAIGEPRSVR